MFFAVIILITIIFERFGGLKLKRTKIKFCSAVLSATTLMSMFTPLPINAAETNPKATQSSASFHKVENENGIYFYGPTGNNLTNKDEFPEDVKVINSISEYNELKRNASVIYKSNKLVKKQTHYQIVLTTAKVYIFPRLATKAILVRVYFGHRFIINIPTK